MYHKLLKTIESCTVKVNNLLHEVQELKNKNNNSTTSFSSILNAKLVPEPVQKMMRSRSHQLINQPLVKHNRPY